METVFLRSGGLGIVRLNRPQVLNALGPSQFPAIHAQLRAWGSDSSVGAVIIEGSGQAFCAGGDIKAVWQARNQGNHDANRALFAARISSGSRAALGSIDIGEGDVRRR
ncbi:enoyl-CoA hydratase/isomerase family protein [Magnetospirillum aberrantis]|uniref:3-hydroxyisobutyryl-CoA hydrolase n=1 Tax=Magnetospirillum aberrantis SpK TaxID=908842 RepID=A0A7C9UXY0_9PROT|nr:enoyl-CoA hydratase/isomerase family protein [Magnetospirillum aberrantis]NFV79411.1 enoyl-CoA hydratase/isomerase family protein [Magnetospirillum aberrantis SpK]